MSDDDIIRELARTFAINANVSTDEAEEVLRTVGINAKAIEQEEDWDG